MRTENIPGEGVIGKAIEMSNYEWNILKEHMQVVVTELERQADKRRHILKRHSTEDRAFTVAEKALINKDIPLIASVDVDDVRNFSDEVKYSLLIVIKSLHKVISSDNEVDKNKLLVSMLFDYDAIAPTCEETIPCEEDTPKELTNLG